MAIAEEEILRTENFRKNKLSGVASWPKDTIFCNDDDEEVLYVREDIVGVIMLEDGVYRIEERKKERRRETPMEKRK